MKTYIPYIVIAVLLVSLVVSLTNRKEVVIEKTTSDTVTVTKLDTVKYEKPIFVTERIIDTIYVEKDENGEYTIAISQRYYKDEYYEAWVSGYRPNLDSINVFTKTVTSTITNTVTKNVYPKTTDLYLNGGVDYIGKQFTPNLGLSVKFKNNMVLGGSVGLYDKELYYGFKLGIKLNSNN